jgi:epoxyqueuosine reductase
VNIKARAGNHAEFASSQGIGPSPSLIELLEMDEAEFKAKFRHSPVRRAKWEGIKRNAAVALGNAGDAAVVPALVRALGDSSALVRGHIAWALGRLSGETAEAALREQLVVEEDNWVKEEIWLALQDMLVTSIDERVKG